ncbi:hypothetical protein C8J56DRAFT_1077620 [Mycena floridula]|nr:hypothetical protein C8J56DRAFT_1077620 [Mycena floridula]
MNVILRLLGLEQNFNRLTQPEPSSVQLPQELVLEIFLIAFREWNSIQLLRVAKWIHRELQQDLYATVQVVKLSVPRDKSAPILMNGKPLRLRGSFYPHIRTLILESYDLKIDILHCVLSQATGLQAIMSHGRTIFGEKKTISLPAPSNFNRLWIPELVPSIQTPFFENITHLMLTDFWEAEDQWTAIRSLPSITHLGLDPVPIGRFLTVEGIEGLLAARPSMMLVWLVIPEHKDSEIAWGTREAGKFTDLRVVAFGVDIFKSYIYDAKVLRTWEMAEELVQQQIRTGTRAPARYIGGVAERFGDSDFEFLRPTDFIYILEQSTCFDVQRFNAQHSTFKFSTFNVQYSLYLFFRFVHDYTFMTSTNPHPCSPTLLNSPSPANKSILQRRKPYDFIRPTPRFENDPSPKRAPRRLYSDAIPATSIPAIFKQLEEKYSVDLVRRVQPNIMPSWLGKSAYLAEPYEVTLKQAVKDGKITKERLKQLLCSNSKESSKPSHRPSLSDSLIYSEGHGLSLRVPFVISAISASDLL